MHETFGRIDGFIANAGFGVAGRVDALTLDDYRRQFDTNVFPVIHGFQLVRDELVKNRGFYCAVGSVNSYLSLPTASAYAMSKFSVRALMEALYWEMKPFGVSVTLACPGFVKTEIRKVNNRGEYRERAEEPVPEWLMMNASSRRNRSSGPSSEKSPKSSSPVTEKSWSGFKGTFLGC
jgi:short-subunit dehydrogenase